MSIKHWKTLSRKVVLEHPRMRLVEDKIELPNGQSSEYLRVAPAATHSVAIIALNDTGEILLQQEYSYPPDRIMWQLPGGAVEEGEDILDAAKRELHEESDIIATNCKIIGSYYINNRRSDEKQYLAVCSGLRQQAGVRDPEEFIESYWVPIATLTTMIAEDTFDNMFLLAALNLWLSSRQIDIQRP